MKKSLPIILIGGAIAFFLFKDKLGFGKKLDLPTGENSDENKTDASDEKTDAIIDVEKTGGIAQAIQQAKEIAQVVKDAKILIKTPSGEKNIEFRTGRKKRKTKQPVKCSDIKSKRKRKKCEDKTKLLLAQTTANMFSPVKLF